MMLCLPTYEVFPRETLPARPRKIGQLHKQEAQLSQKDRSTLHVIGYFAKSLKITQGHSK